MAARDYGQRRAGKGFGVGLTVFAVALVAAAAVWMWRQNQSEGVAEFQHWVIAGAPCAATSKAAFDAAGVTLNVTNVIDQAQFARAYGHVSCSDVRDRGGRGFGVVNVCQFSSPLGLRVRTPKGEFYYLLPAAKPVVISIVGGVPACVFGSTEWDRMGT
jgi:hypothetical protein